MLQKGNISTVKKVETNSLRDRRSRQISAEAVFILHFGFGIFGVKKDCNLGKYPLSLKRGAWVVEWWSDKASCESPLGNPEVRALHLVAEYISFLRIFVWLHTAIPLSIERVPCN